MSQNDRELSNSFLQSIDRTKIHEEAWDGTATRLQAGETLHMPQTPDGPLVIAYHIPPKLNRMANLSLFTPGERPNIVMIQPGFNLPGIFSRNWAGKDLYVTNFSPVEGVEVWVTAMGVIPNMVFDDIPRNEVREFVSGHSARVLTQVGYQQVVVEAQSPEQTLFAVIVGASETTEAEALVYAVYADENSGPGTDREPPVGYFATTKAANFTYELYVEKEAERPSALYLKNISHPSEDSDHAEVYWRLLG